MQELKDEVPERTRKMGKVKEQVEQGELLAGDGRGGRVYTREAELLCSITDGQGKGSRARVASRMQGTLGRGGRVKG